MELTKIIWRIVVMALFLGAILFAVRFCDHTFSEARKGIKGDGNVIRKELPVEAPFTTLVLEGSVNAYIRQGSAPNIVITTDSNLFEHIQLDYDDEVLTFRHSKKLLFSSPVQLLITVPDLHKVVIEGAVELEIQDTLRTEQFALEIKGAAMAKLLLDCNSLKSNISGAGEVRIAGKANTAETVINGAGKFRAKELFTMEHDVTLNGAGSAYVHAEERLKATINGAGVIEYSGNPQVTQQINGVGKIRQ
jgi:hypothetical protein